MRTEYAAGYPNHGAIRYYKDGKPVRTEYAKGQDKHGEIEYWTRNKHVRTEYAEDHPYHGEIRYFKDGEVVRTVLTKYGILQRWRAALDWVVAKHRVEWKQDRYDRMETAKHAVESRKRAIVRERAAGKARERADKQKSDVEARERELASHTSGPAHRVAWSKGALSVGDAVIRKSKKEIAREKWLQAMEKKREREKLTMREEATRQKALVIAHELDLAMTINPLSGE